MSNLINSRYQRLADVESSIRRMTFKAYDTVLCGRNARKVQDVFILWYSMFYEVLTASGTHWNDGRWLYAIEHVPVDQLLGVCKEADSLILESCEYGVPDTYDSFKHCLRSAGYSSLGVVPEVKGLIADWFQRWDPDALRTLRSLLRYPTKLHLELAELEEKAERDYLAIEESLRCDGFSEEEKAIIEEWFPKHDAEAFMQDLVPKHGNGSVQEGSLRLYQKKGYEGCADARLLYLIRKTGHPFRATGFEWRRETRTCFVPKSFDKYRTISCEPAVLMFWQQACFSSFCRFITTGPWKKFGRRYNPTTQEPNRVRALRGSVDGSFATIDLSAASDSVAWGLVKAWFRETALWWPIFCTRSTHTVLPDGCRVALKKYAPMGCALTFPIECVVFAAIVEAAIRECGGDPELSAYRVYGDDIVVETRYYDKVVERLTRNGFKVNTEKSFKYGCHCFFRESCGLHALNGKEVTPLICSRRISSVLYNKKLSSNDITSLIDMANSFYEYGFSLARGLCVRKLLSLPERLRPLFSSHGERGTLFSTMPTNFHLRTCQTGYGDVHHKWRQKGDIWYVHGTPVSSQRSERHFEAELDEWLRIARDRIEVVEPLIIDTASTRDSARWVSTKTPAFAVEDYRLR